MIVLVSVSDPNTSECGRGRAAGERDIGRVNQTHLLLLSHSNQGRETVLDVLRIRQAASVARCILFIGLYPGSDK